MRTTGPSLAAVVSMLCTVAALHAEFPAPDLTVDGGNTTNITSGANIYGNAYVGTTTSSNRLNVLNAGTSLESAGTFIVGQSGSSNSLVISNGAAVSAASMTISANAGAADNTVDIWSGSLTVQGTLNIGAGGKGTLQVGGGVVTVANLVATNYGNGSFLLNSIIDLNGGTILAGGAHINNGDDFEIGGTNASYVASGGMHTFSNNIIVGFDGGSNSLMITNGAGVQNVDGFVGYRDDCSNNSVLVTGANSAWTNTGNLYVGHVGSGNNLVISDGGTVRFSGGYVGWEDRSSNNSVLVTGDSSWSTGMADFNGIYVGYAGSSNSLVISNGANVTGNNTVPMVIGNNTNASNNSVLVTGANSSIYANNYFDVGNSGSGNSLVVSNGGSVSVQMGIFVGAGESSSNNLLSVTGSGSVVYVMTASSGVQFAIGDRGSGNRLVISNGAYLRGASDFAIGNQTNANGNSMLVTGAGSALTNNRGAVYVGNCGSGNSLVISNGGWVENSGDIGGVNFNSIIGSDAASSNNSVLVTGANSTWNAQGSSITVGYAGTSNSLTVSDGGSVNALSLYIASQAGSSGTLNFEGGTVSGQIEFGAGAGLINFKQTNALAFSSLGTSIMGSGTLRQLGSGTTTLTGSSFFTGAVQVSSGTMVLGGTFSSGISNITVSTGGTLQAVSGESITPKGTLNFQGGTVTGPVNLAAPAGVIEFNQTNAATLGSAISGGGTLRQLGTGTTTLTGNQVNFTGTLEVSAGTLVLAPSGIRPALGGTDITVRNSGRLLASSSIGFVVGDTESGSSLVISNGGFVQSQLVYIGSSPDSIDNSVLVAGPGSRWTNSGEFRFGANSSGNILVISNGGVVVNRADGFVGWADSFNSDNGTTASNNLAMVTGAGSIWTNQNLAIGFWGNGNRLVISNGGSVINQAAGIGNTNASGFSNNSVLVTGPGSVWSNSQTLAVANGGSNILTVAEGGVVYAAGGLTIQGTGENGPGGTLNIGTPGIPQAGGPVIGNIQLGGEGASIDCHQSNAVTLPGVISGHGAIRQLGTGTTILTASNAFTAPVTVSGGTLELNSATGGAGGSSTNFTVTSATDTSATLSLWGSSQIKTNAAVTLGNAVIRLSGVAAQTFGRLTMDDHYTVDSSLDFGTSGVSSLDFGTFVPTSPTYDPTKLKLINFTLGDSFTFTLAGFQGSQFNIYFSIAGDYRHRITTNSTDNFTVTSLGSGQYYDWTTHYGLDPLVTAGPNAGAPTADPDNDSFDNNSEYAFGGNPTNPTPYLINISGSNISYIGLTNANTNYTVQNTTNLSTGAWTNYTTTVTNATNQLNIPLPSYYQRKEFTVPITAGTNNFYRVIFSNQ